MFSQFFANFAAKGRFVPFLGHNKLAISSRGCYNHSMRKVITFDSGFRLVISTNNAVRSVAIGVFVRAGVIVEKPEENGISHFIEHMLFKGTTTRSAYEIAREMDVIGANINAGTGKTYTCFYTSSIDTDAEKCIDMLSDIYFNPTFDPEELERERKVVFEEIDENEDDPYDVCYDKAFSETLKGSPFERTILGTKESLSALTRDDLVRYHKEKYVANNTVLSIAGNVTEEQAVALARKYFEDRFTGEVFDVPEVPSAVEHSHFESVNKKIEQAHVMLTFPCYASGSEEHPIVSLLSSVFCGEMSSRLFQSVREKLGLCYSIGGYGVAFPGSGVYLIYTSTNKQSVSKAVKAIRKEIDLFLKDGITDDELTMGKAKLKTALVLGQESSNALMKIFGRHLLIDNELFDIDKEIEFVDGITKDDVRRVASRIFDTKNVCATLVSDGVEVNVLEEYLQG